MRSIPVATFVGLTKSDRNPRGRGTFALIAEPEGLYIGDDTDFLNGTRHAKFKFLPLSNNVIDRPDAPSLPTSVVTPNGGSLLGINFDGSTFGAQSTVSNSGWSDTRGGVFVGGILFHADSQGRMWSSVFANDTFQPRTQVDMQGLDDSRWDIDQIGGMFFDYQWGRIYYTLRNDSRLFWRGFTPASPYFEEVRTVADVQGDIPWSDVRGMDVIDGNLYFSRTNDNLYRAQIQGADVVSGTTQLISGPGVDGRNWDNDLLAFLSDGTLVNDDVAEYEFESSGSDTVNRFQRFEFEVDAGEETVLRLQWDNPNGDLALFVKNPDNQTVAFDNDGGASPIFLNVPAGAGGTYTAAVLIRDGGSTAFNLQVNPFEVPDLPDYEFSSSGSPDSGRWQVFRFDINAGETIDAEVVWDDPNADVRVFLRDETGAQVDRDTNGLPATLSTVAQSSGRWSIGVSIVSGTVNYDIVVNTTP